MTTIQLQSFHVDLELDQEEINDMIRSFKDEYNLVCKIIDDETISYMNKLQGCIRSLS